MEKSKSKKTKCIRVSEDAHKATKEFIGAKIKIGEFTNEALFEKIKKEKTKTK